MLNLRVSQHIGHQRTKKFQSNIVSTFLKCVFEYTYNLLQDCVFSIVNILEIPQSCAKLLVLSATFLQGFMH